MENNLVPIFKSKFEGEGDHYMVGEDNKLHTVYVGESRPDSKDYLVSVKGGKYFLLDKSRLLLRQSSNGNIYYKVKQLN